MSSTIILNQFFKKLNDENLIAETISISNLTQLTPPCLSSNSSLEPICIQLYNESDSAILADDSYDFKKNRQTQLDSYYEQVEDDQLFGYEKYERECNKYNLVPVLPVRDALKGNGILNLSSYGCGTLQIQLIFEILTEMPVALITHLDLSHSQIDEFACTTLKHFIQKSFKIQYLNLHKCLIGSKGAEILSDGIQVSQSICYLNLSACNINDTGGAAVGQAMAYNEFCRVLDLSHNQLCCKSAEALGEMLSDNTTLTTLELGWNDLYPEEDAIIPLFEGLKQNTGLIKLGLSWNGLTGELFSKSFRKALQNSDTLEMIDIQNNRLQSIDVKNILIGLRKAKVLHTIYLGGNSFTNEDIELLINVFNVNPHLKFMSLGSQTWISQKASQLVKTIKRRNPSIEIIFKGTLLNYPPKPINFRNIIIDRCHFLALKPKKARLKRNMGHLMLQFKEKKEKFVTREEFKEFIREFKVKLDDELVTHLIDEFTVEITGKSVKKRISLDEIADYYLKKYPTEHPKLAPENFKSKKKSKKSDGVKNKK